MGRLVMGYWDCPYCDTKGNRGDVTICPGCGRPRGDVKFYMKGQEGPREADEREDIEYVDEEKAKYVNRNPDWYCSFCETLNSDDADTCRSCGASRADSEANYFQMRAQKEQRGQTNQAAPAKRSRSRLPVILIAIALAVVGLVVYMNGSKTGDFRVSGVSWQRAIQVEQNIEYHESGWSVPAGGSVTDQRSEVHHYDTVLDHYESVEVQRSRQVVDHYETYYTYTDLGNGMYEEVPHERAVYATEYYTETEQQPVYRQVARYQTKYYYDIWRWTATRTATAGGEDHNAYWPDTNLAEDEREGQRTEAYRITVTDKNSRTTRYRLAESDWANINPGDMLYITARRSGAEPYISDEKGNPLVALTPD